MRNLSLTVLAAALALAFTASAAAGPKPQAVLTQPTEFQCSWSEGSAASSWDDSNTNAPNTAGSKYGGDLETTVHYGWTCNTDDVLTSGSAIIEVETDLSTSQSATYSYACSGAAPDGACTGTVDGSTWWASITSALDATSATHCPTGIYAHTTDGDGEGFSVSGGVKSMIPGQGNGPQNYSKTAMEPCAYTPD